MFNAGKERKKTISVCFSSLNVISVYYISAFFLQFLWLTGFRLFVSDSGEQVFVVTESMIFYMWEASPQRPHWWKLFPPAEVLLPSGTQREISMDCGFYVHQVYKP